MHMKISTKGRYALRLMIDLAQHDAGGYIPLRDISRRQGISAKYLEQIVVQLSRAGFVKSTRGVQGGYQLAKQPAEYTVGDILRITEGSLAPVACLECEPVECVRAAECATLDFWRGLFETVNQYVDATTLEDLVKRSSAPDYSI
jgi:Rrf2 family protein